mmetsp:Transcript_13910/g.35202  ORF Transcript_13910/g.35202 Transcript_13910/m.35202 type:complete len:202 (+) Transcript_13910:323-928(+)
MCFLLLDVVIDHGACATAAEDLRDQVALLRAELVAAADLAGERIGVDRALEVAQQPLAEHLVADRGCVRDALAVDELARENAGELEADVGRRHALLEAVPRLVHERLGEVLADDRREATDLVLAEGLQQRRERVRGAVDRVRDLLADRGERRRGVGLVLAEHELGLRLGVLAQHLEDVLDENRLELEELLLGEEHGGDDLH